jgi:hypothetical protein
VTELRATVAIVRRHIDRRFAIDFAMQFALVGAIGYIFAHAFAAPSIPIVLCGALAAASAAEREHAAGLRRVSFFAMPLFGRQLARAHAIAPVLSALSVPLGFVVGSAFRDAPPAPVTIAIALLATIVAVLVSLSSVFRDGARAALYVGLAIAASAVLALVPYAVPAHALVVALAVAVVIGFFALRAFGETLARYDPLPATVANA